MRYRPSLVILVATAVGFGSAGALTGASAAWVPQPTVVSEKSLAGPPIVDGTVYAITEVGSTVVVGGSFSQVDGGANGVLSRRGVVAYDTGAKQVSATFAPQFNGVVRTLLPGPRAGTVYVGGNFNQVDGVRTGGLVLLDVATGARVPGFSAGLNGVQSVKRLGNRLFVGGNFPGGLATLDATTGARSSFLSSSVAQNHSWTPDNGWVRAPVGVDRVDVTADGTRLVAIGNFKTVDGLSRDQVAMWDISGDQARLRDWHPPQYDKLCSKKYDSYVRDVDFSPDGSYLVIVTTGGKVAGSLCDTAARFETAGSGPAVTPTWVSASGADSLLSTTVSGAAVYVGGHQRWLNNPNGGDVPKTGAVPRAGVAALDPENGMPLAWNPGRHPRGDGTYALHVSSNGLWMGSDTNFVGHHQYRRQKVAFFPLAGGSPSAKTLPVLPTTVYVGTQERMVAGVFDGAALTNSSPVTTPLPVDALRGITTIGQTLFYGKADGLLYERSLSPTGTFGPEALVNPYNDPEWMNVLTGSLPPLVPENQTYDGVRPNFYSDVPLNRPGSEIAKITSMFYDGKSRLYYTLAGSTGLFYRAFSPDIKRHPGGVTTGGVIFPNRSQVPNVSMPAVTGAFLTGRTLYFVKQADRRLYSTSFVDGRPTGATTLVDSSDWGGRALFLAPEAGNQTSAVASP